MSSDAKHIQELHRQLNAADVLPAQYLRRTHVAYPLVAAVNHTIALWQSRNLSGMAVLVRRARTELDRVPDTIDSDYRALVEEYLTCAASYLVLSDELDADIKADLRAIGGAA